VGYGSLLRYAVGTIMNEILNVVAWALIFIVAVFLFWLISSIGITVCENPEPLRYAIEQIMPK